MRKYVIITLVSVIGFKGICAQSPEKINKDSLVIDSLQKILPNLKDTPRINCLNTIAEAFIDRADYKFKRKCDSAMLYSEIAKSEAKKSNYSYGVAKSLVLLCYCHNLYSFHNRNTEVDNAINLRKWEDHLKQLFELTEQVNDAEVWGRAFENQSNLMDWKKNNKGSLLALENAAKWFKKAGNINMEGEMSTLIGYSYKATGNYETAFEYFANALKLARQALKNALPGENRTGLLQIGLMNISDMYYAVGDYESALNYLNEYRQLDKKSQGNVKLQLINVFTRLGQYDSAFNYLRSIPWIDNRKAAYLWPSFGDVFLLTGNKDSALHYYSKAIDSLRKDGQFWPVVQDALMRSCLGKAKILALKKESKDALRLVKESSALAKLNSRNMVLLECYDLQAQIFNQLRKNDSAYAYLRKYTLMKDSMLTRQFLFRLKNYKNETEEAKKEARMGFLNRDNKIKEQQLKQEASLKKSLIAGLILLLITGVFIFRYLAGKRKNEKLESEKKQAELQQRATELEMQALRAQMNPHFIFNCLSSINKFILKNDTDTASDYLTRFSRLIRQVLTNSQLSLIPLSDEIETLRLYLDMERLRFSESFTYNIIYENTIEPEIIYIPPMMLQPFCENAIWHGLMHKEGPGKLDIVMSTQNGELQCIIADNGIGREKAAALKTKTGARQKSFGLKITTDRLALFNNEKAVHSFFRTEDLLDEGGTITGTKVILNIKFKNTAEQPVKELI